MTGRVFVTGDKHGSLLPLFGLAQKNDLNSADILIIAGDAGYIWNEDYPYKVETLQQVFPGTIAFIDGNHENHAILNALEVCSWHHGKAHRAGERFFHLMRGEVYSIYGDRYFTFGGARSVDRDRRVEGESWWQEEEPAAAEIAYGQKQLMEYLHEIDYVITHETPLFARKSISRNKPIDDDYRFPAVLDEWYEAISEGKRFKKWYFGHMHVDQAITPKLQALHADILLAGEDKRVLWA